LAQSPLNKAGLWWWIFTKIQGRNYICCFQSAIWKWK